MKASLLGATFALLGIVACSAGTSTSSGGPGTSSGNTSGGSGSSSGTTTNSSTFECCINSAFYKCPDQATLDRCGNFQSPDPSGCTRQAKACGSTPSSSSSSGSNNTSGNKAPGEACELGKECAAFSCECTDGTLVTTQDCLNKQCNTKSGACTYSCESHDGWTGR